MSNRRYPCGARCRRPKPNIEAHRRQRHCIEFVPHSPSRLLPPEGPRAPTSITIGYGLPQGNGRGPATAEPALSGAVGPFYRACRWGRFLRQGTTRMSCRPHSLLPPPLGEGRGIEGRGGSVSLKLQRHPWPSLPTPLSPLPSPRGAGQGGAVLLVVMRASLDSVRHYR
jgi:hypothetical protein